MNPRDLPVVHSLRASISALPRRVSHGGAAWLRRRDDELRQPQDGAGAFVARAVDGTPAGLDGIVNKPLKVLPPTWSGEGDDAHITGGTRCLMRRLLGLNVTSRKAEHPAPALAFRKAVSV